VAPRIVASCVLLRDPQGAGLLLGWRHAGVERNAVYALDARFLGVDAIT
jgi:hypothetical protein